MSNKPIQAGYYGLVPWGVYLKASDTYDDEDAQNRLMSSLGKSPSMLVTQPHGTIDGLFWVWKVMRNGWIFLLLGDGDHRSGTPGEAYQKVVDSLPDDSRLDYPLSVMWMEGIDDVVVH